MRSRSFTASDMVQLPRFDAGSAIAAGTSIKTVFGTVKKQPLTKAVHKAAERLFASHAELRAEFTSRITETAASGDDLRAADSELDACWASLYGFLGAYDRLPLAKKEESKVAGATRVLAAVFVNGLKFTQLPYKLQWVESQARLDLLSEKGHTSDIKALSGEIFLTTLRASHERYGDLQGLTKESTVAPSADVRGKLDAFNEALRNYVVKVSAFADDDDDESLNLVEKLLSPLQSWETPGGSRLAAQEPPIDPAADPPVAVPPTPGNVPGAPQPAAAGTPPNPVVVAAKK